LKHIEILRFAQNDTLLLIVFQQTLKTLSKKSIYDKKKGAVAEVYNVALNEVKGLLSRLKNEILPPYGGQNDTMGLSNSLEKDN